MSEGRGGGLLPYLALLLLAFIWGLSFFFIKVGVGGGDLTPEVLVLIRVASAGATLAVIMAAMRRSPAPPAIRRRLPDLAVMGVLSGVLPWVLIGWGETHITSGLASILNASTPLWTSVLAIWLTPGERPGWSNFVGVGVGLAGTLVLVGPDLVSHGLTGTTLGILAVLVASFSYAAGAVFQRRRLAGIPPIEASLWQMLWATVFAIPIALPSIAATRIEPGSLLAALALGVFGTAAGYILYYYLLNSLGAARATTVTFLLPMTAVCWSALLLRERVTFLMVAGMAVILFGVLLTTRRSGSLGRRAVHS